MRDGVDHVVRDSTIARFVIDQFLLKGLELHPLVAIRRADWKAVGWTRTTCSRGPCSGLGPRIDAVANRPTLHDDDRMVTILSGDGCRQADDEPGLRLPRHGLETVCGEVVTRPR